MSLRQRTLNATFWSGVDVISRQGLRFGISIMLARLLAPSEFGLLGMLSLFVALAGAFVDSGFSSALIQRRDVSQTDLSSVFYFNIILGAMMALAVTVAAPWIAAFYEIPLLTPLARLSALSLFIGSFGSVQLALRTRDLDFKTQTKISIITVVLSGGLGVTLAWHGYGVWSLAWQGVASAFISTVLFWIMRPWRPSLMFSIASLRALWSFGSSLLFSGLLNALFSKLHLLLIGKLYSPADLGFYTRAHSTQQLPTHLLSSVVSRVAFPLFSSVQDDPGALRKGLRKAVSSLMMINLPMMLGIAVTARPLVLFVFGDKWEPSIPYLQLLCIAGVLWPLHVINLNVLKAMGRSDLFFRLDVIKKVLLLSILLITFRIGILAIAWGQILLSVLSFLLNAYYLGKLLDYSAVKQVRDFSPYLLCALIMAGVCHVLSYLPMRAAGPLLVTQVVSGAFVYLALAHRLKLAAITDAHEQIRALVGIVRARYA